MMMFWWLLVIPVILIFIWWGMSARRTSETRKPTADPLATLKDRYAKGEIDKEEFEEKKKSLLG